LAQIKLKMRDYKRKFKEFMKIKALRTNMEKLRLISSQIIRREKLKLRLQVIEQDFFIKSTEKSLVLMKNHPNNQNNQTFQSPATGIAKSLNLLRKSIRKRKFTRKPKKIPIKTEIKPEVSIPARKRGRPPSVDKKPIFALNTEIVKKTTNFKEKSPKNLKIKEKIKARKNKLLKLIRKTTNSILPALNQRKNLENPNEPLDTFEDLAKKPHKFLKCELKGLVRTQNSKELALFMEITKKSLINKKLLRSRNVKRKLRSNKMYRFQA